MIDIAVSAQERADIKAEMKRTQEAYNTDVSIAVLGTRILVLHHVYLMVYHVHNLVLYEVYSNQFHHV